ncbi:hypothetical protein VNO77_18414 [Canavalia gladiata]|uniref:FAF domain-containing protein n=1 Tax=Canavalia gladiata TaxID=3824 RepID=A0AAN9LKS3_CANGL
MMINLFKKNIHSFLSFTTADTCRHRQHHHILGLGLVTATMDVDRPPNVLESAMLRPNANNNTPPDPSSTSSLSTNKRVIGFVDDVGGGVDGLKSCTESLGFESTDEIHIKNNGDDDKENHDNDDEDDEDDDEMWRRRMMRAEGRGNWKKLRLFPPPLSSLNRNGKPSFYLRPVRKDGRLELMEVRIQRSEILHASRHNGRLTLRLIPEQNILEEEEEDEEEEDEEEEEELEGIEEEEEEEELEEMEEEDEIRNEKEEERVGVGEWRGLRRCHEMVNQHHHHVHGNLRMCGIGIV